MVVESIANLQLPANGRGSSPRRRGPPRSTAFPNPARFDEATLRALFEKHGFKKNLSNALEPGRRVGPSMKDISIVIPCYNSAATIRARVAEFERVLKATMWKWEIVLCDDASQDETVAVCRALVDENPDARRFLGTLKNRGRGKNVSEGLASCEARFLGFTDADASTSAVYLLSAVAALEDGYEGGRGQPELQNKSFRAAPSSFSPSRGARPCTNGSMQFLLGFFAVTTRKRGFKFFRRGEFPSD